MTHALVTLLLAFTAQPNIDFEQQVRPILVAHCAKCHGPDQQKGGLRLDVRHTALRGGDGGPVITPGKSAESELLRRITSDSPADRMPPEGPRLSPAQIELLRNWIAAGANWPETDADRRAAHDPRLDHWAWQPLSRPEPPNLPEALEPLVRNEIDRFILARLHEHGLTLAPPADRRTLIRRLSFDLLGLPPTPEEVERFVHDPDPRAIEHLVDRLLASPQYGERWARHWLDIAHYADTHGFERDQRRDHAWPYRDWVIQSLNADMPYDQFLRDQIAGDVLRPEDPRAVTATGFLAAGPWDFVGQAETPSPVLKRLARADDLDDMVTQVLTAACGVTINCARCHDHKLDPISQREYYSLWSIFAGVKRGDRIQSVVEQRELEESRTAAERQLAESRAELARLRGSGWSLADIVGGGDGLGSGKPGAAVDPKTGGLTESKRGFLEGAETNRYAKSNVRFVDGVVIPDGGESGQVPISSTGLVASNVPDTSGRAWDAIRNGPVNSQFSTKLEETDFAAGEHTLLSLHANAAITFDLAALRSAGLPELLRLQTRVGYFGQTPRNGASFHIFIDGQLQSEQRGLGRDDGLVDVDIELPAAARFLTLMATDHGNDISHDQICFADAVLVAQKRADLTAEEEARIATLRAQIEQLQHRLKSLPAPQQVYAVRAETPPAVHVLLRGNPEQPGALVGPGSISCLPLPASFGSDELTDAERRIALADWIVSNDNPLTSRVIVNRLWHHHFGSGIVDTPSDFGLGGGRPSHPELLDWLANQLMQQGWSLKSIHRLICLSATYRQASRADDTSPQWRRALEVDAGNRWLWRQNARRLEAEALRDAVLAVSGKLNATMFGPGYRDFEYKEEYAPVYTYITADQPALWRRSIYRFVVRTTPDPFLTTLDCPNPANLTPTRNVTTTALQSLALLNNDFMLRQADYFVERLAADAPDHPAAQVDRAFRLAFGRPATAQEQTAGLALLRSAGAAEFCRAIFNANEFIYID